MLSQSSPISWILSSTLNLSSPSLCTVVIAIPPRLILRDSRYQLPQHLAVDIGEPAVGAVVVESDFFVVETKEMQDGRIEVVGRRHVNGGAAAEIVGGAVRDARLHAGTQHPHGEAVRVVIASLRFRLAGRHAPEFGRPENE